MVRGVSDSFKVNPVSSAVGTLQWQYDLEYIYASSMTAVSIICAVFSLNTFNNSFFHCVFGAAHLK